MASLNEHHAAHQRPDAGVDDAAPETGRTRRRLVPPNSRLTFSIGIAAVCTVSLVSLLSGPPATAEAVEPRTLSVAAALGIEGSAEVPVLESTELLGQLAASRSQRDAEQVAAAAAQDEAEQAALAARAAEEARIVAEEARIAAEAAAAEAAAAARAAAERAAAEAAAAVPSAASAIARISNSSGPVRASAQAAADAVASFVPGAAGITIGGTRASAADPGGHPSGLALDYMALGNTSLGDAIVAYHRAHWNELGVEYLIYQQRYLSSPNGSWSMMENRGGATANHMDHVHVNYRG